MNPVQQALEASLAHLRDQADPGLPEEGTPVVFEYDHYSGEVLDGRRIALGRVWTETWWVHDNQPGVWFLVRYHWVDGARRMVCGCPEGQAIVEAFEDGRFLDHCWHLRAVMDELHRRRAPSRTGPTAPPNPGMYE